MRVWMLRAGVILLGGTLLGGTLLVGTLLWALSSFGHNPNHDINMEQAREAARRVQPESRPGVKRIPGHGG